MLHPQVKYFVLTDGQQGHEVQSVTLMLLSESVINVCCCSSAQCMSLGQVFKVLLHVNGENSVVIDIKAYLLGCVAKIDCILLLHFCIMFVSLKLIKSV